MAFLRIFIFLLFGFFLAAPCHALDSVNFNPIPISITAQAGSGVPIGSVIAWPVTTNPSDIENWLECNGQSIAASAYPELVALVGATVPDFRGLFLRGVGGNSAALGATQGDAIRNISGAFDLELYGSTFLYITTHPSMKGSFGSSNVGNATHVTSLQNGSGPTGLSFDASRQVPTAAENRPVNKSVRYLIRAK